VNSALFSENSGMHYYENNCYFIYSVGQEDRSIR